MKQINPLFSVFAVIVIPLWTSACAPIAQTIVPAAPCPTPEPFAVVSPAPARDASPLPPGRKQAAGATPSRDIVPTPPYNRQFLEALPAGPESCRPDGTAEDLGVYIYDLTEERELVSINADVPFQFASAFKGPALVYFLSSCRKYWDPSSAAWNEYFQDLQAARGVDYYVSADYRRALTQFLADPAGWKNAGSFFSNQQPMVNGMSGPMDTRYLILQKVHHMIAQSGNLAAAETLQFVFENCMDKKQAQTEEVECGGPNALTSFNAWFDAFAGISYEKGTPRRGLYEYDAVLVNGETLTLPTIGQKDMCASQTAILKCDPSLRAANTYTARDLFKFYAALDRLEDETLREAAFGLLKADEAGPARGPLKNLARAMHALAFSKNGSAFYSYGPVTADAGIVRYKGKSFVIVTLSYDALESLAALYGTYDASGTLVGEPGLIQILLEQVTASP